MIDFEKARDTVEHSKVWKPLRGVGVADCYLNILQKLYSGQFAHVNAGIASREFSLLRDVKQGDPISGLLSNLWKENGQS